MKELTKFTLLFFIFAFLGWFMETIYCSICEKRFIYRGFLFGPICPIYGVGGVLILLAFAKLNINLFADIVLIFLSSAIICTVLEYLVSLLLEKVFKMKIWDYSTYPLNLHGRVWIGYTIAWGVLSVLVVKVLYPLSLMLLSLLSQKAAYIIAGTLMAVMIIDFVLTLLSLKSIRVKLQQVKALVAAFGERIKLGASEWQDNVKAFLSGGEQSEQESYKTLSYKLSRRRIIRTFPNFTLKKFSDQLKEIKNRINRDRIDAKSKNKDKTNEEHTDQTK